MVPIAARLLLWTSFLVSLFNNNWANAAGEAIEKAFDPNDNMGNTPFFLQDPSDQTCLGPHGFTVCDERALWVLTRRVGARKGLYSLVSLLNSNKDGLCLQKKSRAFGLLDSDKVGMGPCRKKAAKAWEFEFVDQTFVRLSVGNDRLVRGKYFKNSISLQSATQGEFIPLIYHPTAVHEGGFFLKAADGKCFNGHHFRPCDGPGQLTELLWGVGIKYNTWGQAHRYFFNFHVNDRTSCIVASGKNKVVKGQCTNKNSLGWGLEHGTMTFGKKCVARGTDNSAVLADCNVASEYISFEVPSAYSDAQLRDMLENQNLSVEEKETLTRLMTAKTFNNKKKE